jgi:putative transcriptional regulator
MTANINTYHYRESGLTNVYLVNGYEVIDSAYGKGVSIQDVDGLHAAIGLSLVRHAQELTGEEVRFLRHELDLSQAALAGLLGVEGQTVARWEKGQTKIPGPAQRLLGSLYEESVVENTSVSALLKRLSDLDADLHRLLTLAFSKDGAWVPCAA